MDFFAIVRILRSRICRMTDRGPSPYRAPCNLSIYCIVFAYNLLIHTVRHPPMSAAWRLPHDQHRQQPKAGPDSHWIRQRSHLTRPRPRHQKNASFLQPRHQENIPSSHSGTARFSCLTSRRSHQQKLSDDPGINAPMPRLARLHFYHIAPLSPPIPEPSFQGTKGKNTQRRRPLP